MSRVCAAVVECGGKRGDNGVGEEVRLEVQDIASICAELDLLATSSAKAKPLHAPGDGAQVSCAGDAPEAAKTDCAEQGVQGAVDRLAQVLLVARDQGLLAAKGGERWQGLQVLLAPLPQRPLLSLLMRG